MKTAPKWLKPVLTLSVIGLVGWLSPAQPIDPWHIFSFKKIATMIFALAAIQAVGAAMAQQLGARTGALLTGFLGGIISSTATTATLAKRSRASALGHSSGEVLTFLAATGAMLFEGLTLVATGSTEVHLAHLFIFIGPIFATIAMSYYQYRLLSNESDRTQSAPFLIRPILKLSVFIVLIVSLSKVCQLIIGNGGLLAITAVVSLFEIHGSVISNVQLHDLGAISINLLSGLLAISVIASYLSKLFLIWTLGSDTLRRQSIKCTLILFTTLGFSWAAAVAL